MLQGEHSAILLTFIKLQFVFKIFVFSIFEWLFYTGFTVLRLFSELLIGNYTQLSFVLLFTAQSTLLWSFQVYQSVIFLSRH